MSKSLHELLCKILAAVPERTKVYLEPIVGNNFIENANVIFSDFERQIQKGATATG